jgi:hypothetical protein
MSTFAALVVESGAAELPQLQTCFERQVLYGGDLATALLEVGELPEERIHALWCDYHELPRGPGGPLPTPNAPLREVIGPELATRYRVLPLARDEKSITVALAEPLDRAAAKELRAAVGLQIKAVVVLALRLRQALNRYASLALQPRIKELILSIDGSVPLSERPPPPPPAPQLPYRRMSEHPEGVVPSTRNPRRARPTTKSEAKTAPPPPGSLTRSGSTVPPPPMFREPERYASESAPPPAVDGAFTGSEAETVPPSASAAELDAAGSATRQTLPPAPMDPKVPKGPPLPIVEPPLPMVEPPPQTVPPRPLAEPPPHLADSAPPRPHRPTDKLDLREADTVPPLSESVEAPSSAVPSSAVPSSEAPSSEAPSSGAPPSERPERTTSPWQGEGDDERGRVTEPWTDDEEDEEPLRDSTEPSESDVPAAASSIRSRFSASLPPSAEEPARRLVRFRHRGPFSAEAAREAIARAEDADTVLQILVRFARQYFERVMLFAVNDDQADLRLLHAVDPPLAKVSLDQPSLLRDAHRSGQAVLEPLGDSGVDAALRDTLEVGDQAVAIVPLYIRGRVVALVYGDDPDGSLDAESVDAVADFAEDAASEIARVIVERKRDD